MVPLRTVSYCVPSGDTIIDSVIQHLGANSQWWPNGKYIFSEQSTTKDGTGMLGWGFRSSYSVVCCGDTCWLAKNSLWVILTQGIEPITQTTLPLSADDIAEVYLIPLQTSI